MILLEPQPHEIVYLDPPWWRTPYGTAKTPYKTMTWAELRAFDLGAWLARDAIVFCWITGPTLLKECAVLSCWCDRFGLYEAGIQYKWIKTKKDGVTPIKASGPRGKMNKQVHSDQVIALTTRKRGRVFELLTERQEQLVYWPKNRPGQHSKKPPVVRTLIEDLIGASRSKVELFAREEIDGWNSWGDQLPMAA
jgi:N6-adenosine-specific RNA methylase IME4